MTKCKISFKYECEEEVSEEDIKMINENLDKVNLEEDIKNLLDEYLLTEEVECDSRILDYKLEFTEWVSVTKILLMQMKMAKTI